eukprot:5781893-Amphidinium_carterae.2
MRHHALTSVGTAPSAGHKMLQPTFPELSCLWPSEGDVRLAFAVGYTNAVLAGDAVREGVSYVWSLPLS